MLAVTLIWASPTPITAFWRHLGRRPHHCLALLRKVGCAKCFRVSLMPHMTVRTPKISSSSPAYRRATSHGHHHQAVKSAIKQPRRNAQEARASLSQCHCALSRNMSSRIANSLPDGWYADFLLPANWLRLPPFTEHTIPWWRRTWARTPETGNRRLRRQHPEVLHGLSRHHRAGGGASRRPQPGRGAVADSLVPSAHGLG